MRSRFLVDGLKVRRLWQESEWTLAFRLVGGPVLTKVNDRELNEPTDYSAGLGMEGGMGDAIARSAPARRERLSRSRSIAKTGMVAAMGVLVLTGFLRGRNAKVAHVVAGVAVLGLSYWHHTLYRNDPLKRSE
jgi:hypothetical protein